MPQIRREKRIEFPVEFVDGLVIGVVVDKNRTTPAWQNSIGKDASDLDAANWIAEVVVDWDVEDDNGMKLPINGESIYHNFDNDDINDFMREIRAVLTPSRAEKNESSQPSSEKPSTQASEPPSTYQNGSENTPSDSGSGVTTASPSTA